MAKAAHPEIAALAAVIEKDIQLLGLQLQLLRFVVAREQLGTANAKRTDCRKVRTRRGKGLSGGDR